MMTRGGMDHFDGTGQVVVEALFCTATIRSPSFTFTPSTTAPRFVTSLQNGPRPQCSPIVLYSKLEHVFTTRNNVTTIEISM
jgi:hypothetical protein